MQLRLRIDCKYGRIYLVLTLNKFGVGILQFMLISLVVFCFRGTWCTDYDECAMSKFDEHHEKYHGSLTVCALTIYKSNI